MVAALPIITRSPLYVACDTALSLAPAAAQLAAAKADIRGLWTPSDGSEIRRPGGVVTYRAGYTARETTRAPNKGEIAEARAALEGLLESRARLSDAVRRELARALDLVSPHPAVSLPRGRDRHQGGVMSMTPCRNERRALRRLAGMDRHDSCPVRVTHGFSAPREAGESYHWTTPSGLTRVWYPGAYGWPTMYHASTRRIEVGIHWLAAWRRSGGVYRDE